MFGGLITGYSIAALVLFAGAIILVFSNTTKKGRFAGERKTLIITGLVAFSIWTLRMAMGLNNADMLEIKDFNKLHYALSCSIETMRTFTLDSDYDLYMLQVTYLLENLFESAGFFKQGLIGASNIVAYLIYIAAPISGGVFILQLISSILPKVRLFLAEKIFWKEIIYFSELNEQSVALAKSIRKDKKFLNYIRRPVLVFADAYIDNKQEKSMELLLSARYMGAICLNDDLSHIHIRGLLKKKIFLIDTDELVNLRMMISLTKNKHARSFKLINSEIYLFSNDDTYALIGDNIKKQLADSKKAPEPRRKTKEKKYCTCGIILCYFLKRLKTAFDKATKAVFAEGRIITVNGNRNIVRNLLSDVPLYEPLIGNECEDKTLNVTVIGAGDIGTEMFLSAYWYGQILGYKLCINVVSTESVKAFVDKISAVNSVIFDTCSYARIKPEYITCEAEDAKFTDEMFCCDGKTNAFKTVMKIYPGKDEQSEEYFRFRYYQTDIECGDFESKLTAPIWEDGFALSDSDYFVVTLGSDQRNLAISDKLNKVLSNIKMNNKDSNKVVISYVVYDSVVSAQLNEQHDNSACADIYMTAFGSLEDVYTVKNICMKEREKDIKNIRDAYTRLAQRAAKDNYKRSQYEYWAEIARALHIRYKVFSAGMMTTSVFEETDSSKRGDALNVAYKKYIEKIEADERLQNSLAWLEHRRWNSFMRINGFKRAKDFALYCDKAKSHKNLELKLHPCLVECDKNGSRQDLFEHSKNDADIDFLDSVSLDVYERYYAEREEEERNNLKAVLDKENAEIAVLEKNPLGRIFIKKVYEKMNAETIKNFNEFTKKTDYKLYDYPKYDFPLDDNGNIIVEN